MKSAKRLLIVDDEVDAAEALKDILTEKDFQVDVVHTGEEVLERVKQTNFDVILLDIKMPGLNGVETYKHIKGSCRAHGTTVIMITALASEDLIQEVIREGVYAVLRKPIEIEELLGMIRQAKEGALVMVVEDDSTVRESLKDLLEAHGYSVQVAASGEEAVVQAKRQTQDIVLLDVNLPAMNGLETYRHMKQVNPNTITVMFTGHRQDSNELIEQAKKAGVYTCLYKPLDPRELLDLIKGLAAKKREGKPIIKPE